MKRVNRNQVTDTANVCSCSPDLKHLLGFTSLPVVVVFFVSIFKLLNFNLHNYIHSMFLLENVVMSIHADMSILHFPTVKHLFWITSLLLNLCIFDCSLFLFFSSFFIRVCPTVCTVCKPLVSETFSQQKLLLCTGPTLADTSLFHPVVPGHWLCTLPIVAAQALSHTVHDKHTHTHAKEYLHRQRCIIYPHMVGL